MTRPDNLDQAAMLQTTPPRRRARLSILSSTLFLVLSSVALPGIAYAETADDVTDNVTWSVEPSDGVTATGKAWIELSLDAGQSVTEHMIITNRGGRDVTFDLSAADGYFTDTGRFNMLRADQESVDAGTWITIPKTADVAAGQSVIVPFEVSVPTNATPGDHPAGVAAGIRTGGDTIGVESRVGFRVMTRVRGELSPALSIANQAVSYTPSWNPFLPGSVSVTSTVVNSGNTRLGGRPTIIVSGPVSVLESQTPLADLPEFAPGESRTVTTVVPGVWPTFATNVETRVDPVTVDGSDPPARATATQTTTELTVPWAQLGLILTLGLAITLLSWRGRKKKNEISRMIENAREEGRRQGGMTSTSLLLAAAVVLAATTLIVAAPTPGWAANNDGVSVEVEITPLPATTSTPVTPSAAPTAPTTAPDPNRPKQDDLARTGPIVDTWLVVAAGGLLIGGATLACVTRQRRKASDATHPKAG